MADYRASVAAIAGYDHFTERPESPTRGYTVYYPAAGIPGDRRLTGAARLSTVVDRVVCVGNTADAAVLLARRVIATLDGTPTASGLVECGCGPTISDPDQTGEFRWSATVTIDYSTAR